MSIVSDRFRNLKTIPNQLSLGSELSNSCVLYLNFVYFIFQHFNSIMKMLVLKSKYEVFFLSVSYPPD
jgi:hypothetical protein